MDQREANQVADFIWAAVEKQVRAAIAAEIAAREFAVVYSASGYASCEGRHIRHPSLGLDLLSI